MRAAIAKCLPHLGWAAAFSAFINLLYLAPTLYMLQVYDRVIPTGSGPTLLLISLAGLVSLVTLAGLEWLRSRLLVRCGARLDREMAKRVLSTVLQRPDLTRLQRLQVTRQYDAFRNAVAGPGALAIFDAPWTPIYILAAFLLNPLLGAFCTFASLSLLVLAWLNERGTHRLVSAATEAAGRAYAWQDQASSYAGEIRALGMCGALVEKQSRERGRATELQAIASFRAGVYGAALKLGRLVFQSAALGIGAYLAIQHAISPGAVIAASLLLTRALSPIEQIVGAWKGIANAKDAYDAISVLLVDAGGQPKTALPAPRGHISLENVYVSSPMREAPVLSNINLRIEAGQMIGVIGASGAGKSTLLRAIAGTPEKKSGLVRIDGADVASWDGDRLARYIGYMPQDFLLFPGTVKENISRFSGYLPGAVAEEVDGEAIAAAKAAAAHELILSLPRGYDTPVGLGGVGLSAGQTQKIALARAFFGKPRILILDEPNAYLDVDGEAQLIASLAAFRKDGATILIAAHRGGVLAAADKLLLLNGGRIDRFGSLADVLAEMRQQAPAPAGEAPKRAQA
jgi:ATP-binding cassette subfamily C protein